mmetsp:Transcript_1784/g.2011  ORF Transcript_1784/g.2011 Transcript_1784/m.2011 type:complete len:144 (-) Transcript_1784:613-1044(-)
MSNLHLSQRRVIISLVPSVAMAATEVNTVGAAAATVAMIPFWCSGDRTGSHGKRGHSHSGSRRTKTGRIQTEPANQQKHPFSHRSRLSRHLIRFHSSPNTHDARHTKPQPTTLLISDRWKRQDKSTARCFAQSYSSKSVRKGK